MARSGWSGCPMPGRLSPAKRFGRRDCEVADRARRRLLGVLDRDRRVEAHVGAEQVGHEHRGGQADERRHGQHAPAARGRRDRAAARSAPGPRPASGSHCSSALRRTMSRSLGSGRRLLAARPRRAARGGGGSAKPQATSSAGPSRLGVDRAGRRASTTNGTQKMAAAAAERRPGGAAAARSSRRLSSSRPQPASSASANRTKITMRPLCAVRKPGSATSRPRRAARRPARRPARARRSRRTRRRVTVGRRTSAAAASMSVIPPA